MLRVVDGWIWDGFDSPRGGGLVGKLDFVRRYANIARAATDKDRTIGPPPRLCGELHRDAARVLRPTYAS